MARIGYHASHEQFSPGDLLELVKSAEQAGFVCAMSSDHFHPWSERQGQSGYAWSWLGAALEGTRLPFGVISAPGWRYNPAVLAQAAATLCQMYPGRFWMALGSGEAINVHMFTKPTDIFINPTTCASTIAGTSRGRRQAPPPGAGPAVGV